MAYIKEGDLIELVHSELPQFRATRWTEPLGELIEDGLGGRHVDHQGLSQAVKLCEEKGTVLQSAEEAAAFYIGMTKSKRGGTELTRTAALTFNYKGQTHIAFLSNPIKEKNIILSHAAEGEVNCDYSYGWRMAIDDPLVQEALEEAWHSLSVARVPEHYRLSPHANPFLNEQTPAVVGGAWLNVERGAWIDHPIVRALLHDMVEPLYNTWDQGENSRLYVLEYNTAPPLLNRETGKEEVLIAPVVFAGTDIYCTYTQGYAIGGWGPTMLRSGFARGVIHTAPTERQAPQDS